MNLGRINDQIKLNINLAEKYMGLICGFGAYEEYNDIIFSKFDYKFLQFFKLQ